ncbi:hypothetical protein GCK32_019065, partial [Trichostrongylus colubriformis]
EWRVVGMNAYGQCESSCFLTVEIPDGNVAPTFLHPLEDVRCKEGDVLRIKVKVTAYPLPTIAWTQYDDEKGDYWLVVMNAQPADSGEYICIARNVVGRAQCACSVQVGEMKLKRTTKIDYTKVPRFRMPLATPREIPKGTEMVLTCVVTGAPFPDITWLKDGER